MASQLDPGKDGALGVSPTLAGSDPEIVEKHEETIPTASHALAEESANMDPKTQPETLDNHLGEKGAAQVDHGDLEVRNLGWNHEVENVPVPLVGGLRNEDLWTLLRRFNKQIFHVKSIQEPPLANLDLNIADDEDFSPEKLRAQLERLYMVVAISLLSLYKHVCRLRSWRETRRTGAFLGVYAAAWLLDLVVPTVAIFLLVLILYPASREYCFPPAPPSLIDAKTGGVQTPPSGVLASDDSMTGAPQKHQGEAVEQEARSFVNSLSSVCSPLVVSTAAGKHPQGDPHEDKKAPDPGEVTEDITSAKDHTLGITPSVKHDRTKIPVSQTVWGQARPVMHGLADFVDTWERFGNMLSPSAPFPRRRPRLVLASCVLPVLLGGLFVSSYVFLKAIGFGVGFAFFGDPVIARGMEMLNRKCPRWTTYIELRHTLLRGIPTNAQLTLTLLRIGEKNKAPIPPPPSSDVPPPVEPHEAAGQNLEHLDTTSEELHEAINPAPDAPCLEEDKEASKPKRARRILGLLKGTTKGGVQATLTADKAKAKAGARHARDRLGVVKGQKSHPTSGPVRFPARYKGKKGHAYITATATTPALSWTHEEDNGGLSPVWTVAVRDIAELKKVGGLGWKSKIVVGWAMGSEIVDGLLIEAAGGEAMHLTAISMRDELFNRLISMGGQMWEAW